MQSLGDYMSQMFESTHYLLPSLIPSKHISSQTRLDSTSNKISLQMEVMDNHSIKTNKSTFSSFSFEVELNATGSSNPISKSTETETTTSIKSMKRKQSIALAPKRLFSRTKAYFKKKSGRSCKQGTQILDTSIRSRDIEQLYKAMTV